MKDKPTIAVIGGGSWATAIVKILSNNVDRIFWWLRNADTVEFVKKYHHNPNYLSDVEVDLQKINVSSNLKAIIASADCIILAVPSAFLKTALHTLTANDFKGKYVFKTKPEQKHSCCLYFLRNGSDDFK